MADEYKVCCVAVEPYELITINQRSGLPNCALEPLKMPPS